MADSGELVPGDALQVAEEMEVESKSTKRGREGAEDEVEEAVAKKLKLAEQSLAEEVKEVEAEGVKEGAVGDPTATKTVTVGAKVFDSAEDLFDYFFKFLHYWRTDLDINKYEHNMLLELLKKGHSEADKKIQNGIRAFQVRIHPIWRSRCYFFVREDGSVDDFSFRKCVDTIMSLPEHLKLVATKRNRKGHNQRGAWARGRGGRGRGRSRGGARN